jgi:hypothetical protein
LYPNHPYLLAGLTVKQTGEFVNGDTSFPRVRLPRMVASENVSALDSRCCPLLASIDMPRYGGGFLC